MKFDVSFEHTVEPEGYKTKEVEGVAPPARISSLETILFCGHRGATEIMVRTSVAITVLNTLMMVNGGTYVLPDDLMGAGMHSPSRP